MSDVENMNIFVILLMSSVSLCCICLCCRLRMPQQELTTPTHWYIALTPSAPPLTEEEGYEQLAPIPEDDEPQHLNQ